MRDAVQFYLIHLCESEKSSFTVSALKTEFLTEQARLQRSPLHQIDLRHRLDRFCETFGDRSIRTIAPAEIATWLASLDLSPRSVINFHSKVSSLFGYGLARGYLEQNPLSGIKRIKCVDGPPEIFTPGDLRTLLEHAPAALLPCLAIGAFAGLRTAEILRLEWQDIDLTSGHLNVRAKVAKTARRRLIVMADNLRAWLIPYCAYEGRIWTGDQVGYHLACQVARKAADISEWPNNGLRHSFASYHLAKHLDAPALALDMGHVTPALIFSTYREVVTPGSAERYWQIFPHSPANNIMSMVA